MTNFHKRIFGYAIAVIVLIAGLLTTIKTSKAGTSALTGSCGMIVNVSHWGVPITYGRKDDSSNNLLMLINFDTGKITGYATNVTFGANNSTAPTYSVGSGGVDFNQSADTVTGFYELTPTDLNLLPKFKVLPVNGSNTFLIIAGGQGNPGAGGSGVCQKV